jgi:sporulation protein YlmC with PRC-barrel domain
MFYAHQPGEVRASRLIGTRVRNAAGESIGDINDVVLGSDGQVRAVIVGVGGFLGLGEREVAVAMDALQLQAGQSGASTVTVDVMRETLKDAPRWTWAGETSATGSGGGGTGTAPGGTPRTTPKAE